MYVDKKLSGVRAVQTLSRLNRTCPGKDDTFILDFVNNAEDIQEAFIPYYEKTIIEETTDPDLVYNLMAELNAYGVYLQECICRRKWLHLPVPSTNPNPKKHTETYRK